MTKAEMENQYRAYTQLLSEAGDALRSHDFEAAVKLAVRSWDHLDGMIQYQKKYAPEQPPNMETIDLVLYFAPLLLDSEALDRLEFLLKSQKRIRKNSEDNLPKELSTARGRMRDIYRLWDLIEANQGCLQSDIPRFLGTSPEALSPTLESLERIGLIRRTAVGHSHRLTLWTQMNALAYARCHRCGAVVKGEKNKFLSEHTCPKCRSKAAFVILSKQPEAEQ